MSFMEAKMKSIRKQICLGTLFLAVILLGGISGSCQAVYGSLYGTITDNTGAIVPNAQITVTNVNKGTTTVVQSSTEGFWRADNLIPDTYSVKVESGAFAPSQVENLELQAGMSQLVNVALQVAGGQQSITVTAEAPALRTDRAEISESLNERSIQALPNLTRNFTTFALLTPGMQRSTFNILGPENPQGGIALNSNGSNYGVQGFLLDGTDNRDPVLGIIVINPTLDSISEMKVTTQNYDAEFGGAAGGIISASTHNLPVLANEDFTSNNAIGQYSTTLANPPVRPPSPFVPSNGIIPLSDTFGPQFRPERIQLPKVDQWNLTLQQQFGANTTMEIAYVGNRAERIYPGETYGFDLNGPVLASTPAELASGNIAQRRPFYNRFSNTYNGAPVICCSNGMTSAAPAGNANYNALQTKLDKRFSHGLQFNANYTWSKAINYANDSVFARYPRVSRGPNDTNRTNIFVLSGLYQLLFGKNRMFFSNSTRWMDYLIGGYTISGTTTYQSGSPFTPTFSGCGQQQDLDTNFNGPGRSSDCRPDKGSGFNVHAGGFNAQTRTVHLFTPMSSPVGSPNSSGAFLLPAFATFGNVGRNSFRGPNQFLADASLIKDIPVTERVEEVEYLELELSLQSSCTGHSQFIRRALRGLCERWCHQQHGLEYSHAATAVCIPRIVLGSHKI